LKIFLPGEWPTFARIPEILLLVMMFLIIVLAIRVFWTIPSRIYRKQFAHVMKQSLAIGLFLGLVLPWNPLIGLSGALVACVVLLFISYYAIIVSGWSGERGFLRQAWVRREVVREWMIYFSIVAGIIGIVATILSIVIPPFLELSLRSEVPLAFDAISVTAALLDVTIPITSYRKIYSLLYLYLAQKGVARGEGDEYYLIDDTEFLDAVRDTEFTKYEVRDALESLVDEGMAMRTTPEDILVNVEFRVSPRGMEIMRLNHDETIIKVRNTLDRLESSLKAIAEAAERKAQKGDGEGVGVSLRHLEDEVKRYYAENRCFKEADRCQLLLQMASEIRKGSPA